MATPRLPKRSSMTYRLPVEMLARINRYAADHAITGTASVTLLLDDALTRAGYLRDSNPENPEQGNHAA